MGHRENGFRLGGKIQEVFGYLGLQLRRDEAKGKRAPLEYQHRQASYWFTVGCRFLVFILRGSAGEWPNHSSVL